MEEMDMVCWVGQILSLLISMETEKWKYWLEHLVPILMLLTVELLHLFNSNNLLLLYFLYSFFFVFILFLIFFFFISKYVFFFSSFPFLIFTFFSQLNFSLINQLFIIYVVLKNDNVINEIGILTFFFF